MTIDYCLAIMTADQTSRHHHFVPIFLLRPWRINGQLHGYWWNQQKKFIDCKRKGPKAFCKEIDLLTLQTCSLGQDAVEKMFFGDIDTKGASALQKMVADGPNHLTGEERCDFARLLLSLEARRPTIVRQLRTDGSREISQALDNDREVLAEMDKNDIEESPSNYFEREIGISIEDAALTSIQKLVDDQRIGSVIVNAFWHVVRLKEGDDASFVTSDRPFVRIYGYDQPGAVFALPIAPDCAFIATNHVNNLDRIRMAPPKQIAKLLNVNIAEQAVRFVFTVDDKHSRLLRKYLTSTSDQKSLTLSDCRH